ncbi:MAG: tetratricopeptide repeat protein [Thermoguttaceae bacterium]
MKTTIESRQAFWPLTGILFAGLFLGCIRIVDADEPVKASSASAAHSSQHKTTTASSPSDVESLLQRAVSLERQQKFEEAVQQYQKALDSSPQNVQAHNNLAWLLATCPVERLRNSKQAIVYATRACEITQWKHSSTIDTLSVALAEDRQFEKAIELLTKFRDKASASDREKIDGRLELFRAGKTYRQAKPSLASQPASRSTTEDNVDQKLQTLFQEAVALERARRLREAAVQYGKAVDQAKEVLGANHVVTAQLMVREGDMYLYTDQFDAAFPLFKEALPILRNHFPKEHAAVTYCVNELAAVYSWKRQFDDSLRLHRENLAVREATLGKDHLHVLTSLENVASAYMGLNKHEEAVRLLNEWLARNDRGQGDKHPGLPRVLHMLGASYRVLGDCHHAEKHLKRSLEVFKAQASTDHQLEAHVFGELAMLYATAGPSKFDEAKQYAVRALEMTITICGRNSLQAASAKTALATVYQKSRKFSDAEPLLREAVQGMESTLGKDSVEATRYRIELATTCLETGRIDEAQSICLHCVDAIEEQCGTRWYFPGTEEALPLLAKIAGRTGHQSQTETRLKRLVNALEIRLGKDHPLFVKVLMKAGEAFTILGSDAEAKEIFLRCLAIQRATLRPDYCDEAQTLQNLTAAYLRGARYAEAEPCCKECVDLYRKCFGDEHPRVASVLGFLGFLYMRTNRYSEAEKTFEQATAICEKNQGVAAVVLADILGNWGRLCDETRRYSQAETLHKRALSISREIYGEQNPVVAWNLVYLAQLYGHTKRYSEAEPLYRQSLAIFENTEGKGHPDTHVPLTDLGAVLCGLGRYEEAETLLRRSLGVAKNGWSMNDRDRICTLETLADLHLKGGRWKEAIHCCTEAQQAQRSLLSHVLPGLSPAEQMVYLSSSWRENLARSLSLGLNYSSHAEAVEASAEWLLNGKSLSSELLAEQIRLARQSKDPALVATIQELNAVRGQLAHLVLNPDRNSGGVGNAAIAEKLSQRELELSRQLGQQTHSAIRESHWVTLEEVRKNLPAKSVLIEIAKFPIYHTSASVAEGRWEDARYVAWIIPPSGEGKTTLVDLGYATAIDNGVAKCRQCVESVREVVNTIGIERATESTMAEIARLSARVWQPLEKVVADVKSLIVSPDGGLWLYPWEALSDGEKKFLVEKKQISYVVTGRQIAAHNVWKAGTGAAIFADPDYDAELAESGSDCSSVWTDAVRALLGAETPQGLLGNSRVQKLPGAAAEVDVFVASLQNYLAAAPSVYRGKQASEDEFKKLRSPRLLVISTHGFFLPDQAFDNMPLTDEAKQLWTRYNVDRLSGLAGKNELLVPNPLLRCGVVLAGANRRRHTTKANDGVLTGLEILGADLSGTELVVLRACETGVGAVRDAEGTAGLNYAFQLAGAKAVIVTLWPIPMKPSSEIMQTFFDNLIKKQGKAEALRNAQINLIHHLRTMTGSAHPALWGGYTIIGN